MNERQMEFERRCKEALSEYNSPRDKARCRTAFKKIGAEFRDLERATNEVRHATDERKASTMPSKKSHSRSEILAAMDAQRASVAAPRPKNPAPNLREALTSMTAQYLVDTPNTSAAFASALKSNRVMGDAQRLEMYGKDRLRIPVIDTPASVEWIVETGAIIPGTPPTFALNTLTTHTLWGSTVSTAMLIDSIGGPQQVIDELTRRITDEYNASICTGDGSGRPLGIFTETSAYEKVNGADNAITNTNVHAMFEALSDYYTPTAKWYCSVTTLSKLALLERIAGSSPLVEWQGPTAYMLGAEIVVDNAVPAIASGSYSLAYGDMAAALALGIPQELRVNADPYTTKGSIYVDGYINLGSCALDADALVILKS